MVINKKRKATQTQAEKNANERILEGGKNMKSKQNSGKNPKIGNDKDFPKRGNTMQTRDEFLAGQAGKNVKSKHPDKSDLYRTVGVLRKNEEGEYAVVPFTTKKKIKLNDYYDPKTHAKDFIEIFDCDGKPIKVGDRFVPNADSRKVVSERDLKRIEVYCLEKSKRKQKNQKQIERFEKRGKPQKK